MERNQRNKIIFSFIILLILFFIVLAKAFYVQVVNQDKLKAYLDNQIVRKVKIYPKRGSIYDRKGNPLAINVKAYNIFTIPPKNLKNFSEYKKLVKIVPTINYGKLIRKIKKRRRYTWIARKIDLTKEQVKKLKKLSYVYVETAPKRFYPNKSLLAQVLGFVGVDNKGLAGLEHFFDEVLKGKEKVIKYFRDAKGRAVKFESADFTNNAQDIYLTIDKDVQGIAEDYLAEYVDMYKAKKGGVGIIDVKTGEILALANYPSFNPNIWRKSDAKDRKISFISDAFEPGSVFKVITVISALENKVVSPDTNYYCERGEMKVGGHIISEADKKNKHEWLSIEEIIKFSSNIGTTKIAFDLKYPLLKETIKKFKFGEKSGLQLPGESKGIIDNSENITPLKLSNISFGQGIATTPLQILAAYSSIANGGVYHKPTIIKSKKSKGERLIDRTLAHNIEKMLLGVVNEGSGDNAKMKYFNIAGKTGTAQKVKDGGGYEGYISSFVGYPVNVERPFVVYAYIDEPKGGVYYGGLIAAPLVRKISEYILYRYKDFKKIDLKLAQNNNDLDEISIKKSNVMKIQNGIVPNFIGLDKKSSQRIAKRVKVGLRSRGAGIVVSQKPFAGSPVNEHTVVELQYEPPTY